MDIVTHKQFRQLLADHAREHRIPLRGKFQAGITETVV